MVQALPHAAVGVVAAEVPARRRSWSARWRTRPGTRRRSTRCPRARPRSRTRRSWRCRCCRSRQSAWSSSSVPSRHETTQAPARHTCPLGAHAVARAAVAVVGLQVTAHAGAVVEPRAAAHPGRCPPEHTCPLTHARPHIPQLPLSVCRSRHTPAQSLSPAPQLTTHMPREHTSPAAQALPHAPQLERSRSAGPAHARAVARCPRRSSPRTYRGSTHALRRGRCRTRRSSRGRSGGRCTRPRSRWCPRPHETRHAPAGTPAPRAGRAQAPQLARSVWRSLHTPEQLLSPAPQHTDAHAAGAPRPRRRRCRTRRSWRGRSGVGLHTPAQLVVPAPHDTRRAAGTPDRSGRRAPQRRSWRCPSRGRCRCPRSSSAPRRRTPRRRRARRSARRGTCVAAGAAVGVAQSAGRGTRRCTRCCPPRR